MAAPTGAYCFWRVVYLHGMVEVGSQFVWRSDAPHGFVVARPVRNRVRLLRAKPGAKPGAKRPVRRRMETPAGGSPARLPGSP